MKRRPLFWRVYPYYLVIIVTSLLLAALYGAREMRSLYIGQITVTLEAQANIGAQRLQPELQSGNGDELNRVCRELSEASHTRFTVVDALGVVRGDSHEDPGTMENHGTRPEIAHAYSGSTGIQTRYSSTLKTDMMYVAVPISDEHGVVAVVRAAVPVSDVETVLGSFYQNIALGGLVIVVLAGLISVVVLRRLTRPLRELQVGAGRFAAGDLGTRLPVSATEEIADLADSMNIMAEQLDLRITATAQQRNESEAILSSMSEGVLALDAHENIVSLNRVAADFFGLNIESSHSKPYYEVIRIPSLIDLVELARTQGGTPESEISLSGTSDTILQARAGALRNSSDESVGVVIVFNDISRLKKLEHMRRDFVANVSHELKTPITAITGSVETLMDGAADNPEDRQRFLEMIARHAHRLNQLIEDLLSLSRIESDLQRQSAKPVRENLAAVIQASVLACHEISLSCEVNVSTSCDPNLEVNLIPGQLEQAITNLLDNAIKYSHRGSTVHVEVPAPDQECVISIRDHGVGIPGEHLPRLFERFYRVDEARRRDVGGTGLGLAIVKHIAAAHGGHVTVDSQPGEGSIFRIHLPDTQGEPGM